MSNNPRDWSSSSSTAPDPTSAETWVKNMMPQQQAISASQWACVANQNQSIQNLLQSESETGSNNRPPKLNHMNEYPSWKGRFHTYVLGQNTELWLCFTTPYNTALEEADSSAATLATMSETDKKAYDLEKKAFAIMTQALHKELYHQFSYCKTTKALWDILVTRGEGNAATRKTRHDLLKKEFDAFLFIEIEALNEMATRYYHLISEMFSYEVTATPQEMVAKFADALPPKWSPIIELLKHTGSLDTITIYDFIQKLENKNEEEIRKAKRISIPQNPEMYFGGINPAASSSQQPKLQTTFIASQVTNVNPFGFVPKPPQPKPHFDTSAWFPPSQPVPPPTQPKFGPSAWFPQPQPQVTQSQS
ncbi:hypothetical protein HanIR_Chr06g0289501 [Helianthus annuus]|nr:hypothetical protein HanIR_Chr06g0289501 [Helianthus annuus]KAJ0574295.1 hypothetical protein HanHA89_Chr06g0236541 [Helianthus annuus]KAJ0738631.1 hypothetical protein HanLR1_Chr06g0220481 [Helianthus annuus]